MVKESYLGYDTDELISQFAAVRDTGATNMVSKHGVRKVAEQCEFNALADFIREASSEEYMEVLEEMGRRR